jgi:CRISPR-associated protein Cmr1
MTRIIKEKACPPAPDFSDGKLPSGIIKNDYELTVITPLFGGGVEAGANDDVTPIRPSSIRGHLRFWWRATRGAKYSTPKELVGREKEIWGSTENPSPVTIKVGRVKDIDKINERRIANIKSKNDKNLFGFSSSGSEAYVLFPLRPSDEEKKNDIRKYIYREGIEFTLTVSWCDTNKLKEWRKAENEKLPKGKQLPQKVEDISNDVKAAIWAWVNFGGIGARTRKGCGALYCTKPPADEQNLHPPSVDGFKKWLEDKAEEYKFKLAPSSQEWPTLPKFYLLKSANDAMTAWRESLTIMKDFRQGGACGRDTDYGSSLWPEAESIRKLIEDELGVPLAKQSKSRNKNIPTPYFPRAEFGLPIIFELKNERIPDKQENIKPTLQYDKDHSRMASPLILRPICFTGGKEYTAMIVKLTVKPLKEALLKPSEKGTDLKSEVNITKNMIRNKKLTKYPNSPLSDPNSGGSAIKAFLSYAKSNGFREVTL